jgi:hypothetical protein
MRPSYNLDTSSLLAKVFYLGPVETQVLGKLKKESDPIV